MLPPPPQLIIAWQYCLILALHISSNNLHGIMINKLLLGIWLMTWHRFGSLKHQQMWVHVTKGLWCSLCTQHLFLIVVANRLTFETCPNDSRYCRTVTQFSNVLLEYESLHVTDDVVRSRVKTNQTFIQFTVYESFSVGIHIAIKQYERGKNNGNSSWVN